MVAKSTEPKVKNGLLPTPAMSKGLPKAALTDNARQVLMKRYVRRGDDGKPAENVEEMFWRVAYHVAKVEEQWGADVAERTVEYYHLLSSKKFFPNSPTFTGAGTPLGQLAACFTSGMRVTTDQGVKQISQLQIGDRVLTHHGRYRPVTELFQRAYDGELLNIKVRLIGTTMEVTPEHPILTDRGWVKAGELKVDDKIAIGATKGIWPSPIFDLAASQYADELELQVNEDTVRVRRPSSYQNSGRQAEWVNRSIELTPDLARLCGYYISEGTIGPDERYVRFTFAKDEVEYHQDVISLVESIFGARVNRSDSSIGNWTNINVYSRPVVAWFRDHFWKGSAEKRIPVWLQYAEKEIQESFLVGVMRGDGLYFEKTYVISSRPSPKLFRSLRLTLSNPGLIQQIWQMCLRLGYDAAMRAVDTTYVTPNASDTAQISMPPLQSRDLVKKAFGVELPEPDKRYLRNKVSRDENQIYFEVENITSQNFNGVVYNCEVDEDHTYVVEGVVVHNCFVLPITDDMGRHSAGIFQTLRDAALIQQTGGGNGFSFSRLRPKGALVQTSAGQATGPVGFLRVYDHAFGEIAQGGCLLPDTLVFTNKGLLRLDEIVNSEISGWHEHQLSVPTDEGMKTSPRGFNNGVANVLRVHTREGVSITGTPNHKVKVITDNGPQWKEIQDLAQGDWILVRLGEHVGKLQILKKPVQRHGNQVMPELPSILDEEFAFFLGYLAGDGFMAKGNDDHRVGVSVAHSSYLMEEMPLLLKRLFNVNVHKMQKPNDRSVTFVMDNSAIKEFLQMNGLGKARSRDVTVPRLIRQSPQNIVGAYLRGLLEADGALSHGYPALGTSSAQLAREVATLLIGLGCPVSIRTVSAGLDRWGDSATYQVRINSSVGLQAWREKIGCDQRSRFVSAHAWESDQRRESSYVLPNPGYWLQPILEEITLEQIDRQGRGRNINFRATEPQLRRKLLRYLRDERNLTRSGYDLLRQEYPHAFENAPSAEGYWFVEVRGVEEAGQSLTLDLEVDDNHTYLAYGMVTHNTRRGANMAVLRVDHPDVEDFITCKINENQITNFNISVGITDAFMQAVKDDKEWDLRFPDLDEMKKKGFSGTLEQAEAAGITVHTYKKVNARELFNKIVKQAHHNGEPGVLFLDAANRSNPVPNLYPLEATNPCGEQWLGPYENCCLGSVNLNEHCGPHGSVNWETLRQSVVTSTRFLDDVVEANAYVPAVAQLKEAAHKARRIGLGIMGLADLMYHVGVRYGSQEGQEFGAQVMEFVRYHAMKTSIELAEERGPFPAIEGSIYDMDDMRWTPPQSLVNYQNNWNRPEIKWEAITGGIKSHGIRNAAQTTVAPTGTIATVAGCEGYGCEPVFALAYIRHVNDNGKDLKLTYASPRFDEALKKLGLGEEKRQEIVDQVMREGTCQHIAELPQKARDTFVVSADVTAEEHVLMQGALQAFVDNSLSKTVNFHENATEDDVAKAYMMAWELGCKGITVYVTGSRDKVVLETKATADKKAPQTPPTTAAAPQASPTMPPAAMIWHGTKKPRPKALTGKTYNIETPVGKAFITINENGGDQPFEAFVNTAKAGSEIAAVSEAIGRLMSYILRMASPIAPVDRMREIIVQLIGIGGGRSLGFGPNRVRSLPDGIGQILDQYLHEKSGTVVDEVKTKGNGNGHHEETHAPVMKIGDICPECGEAAVVNEEGCRKCYACGFSEC